jgi:addiction module HigA family antidote
MSNVYVAERPNRAPSHPGELLRDVVLPALKMTVTSAAAHLNVSRQQLHNVLSEKAGVSPEMALRLGKFCGNGPDLWISMQQAYDLWKASKKVAKEVSRIRTFCDETCPRIDSAASTKIARKTPRHK